MTRHVLKVSFFAIFCSLFIASCGDDSSNSAEQSKSIANKSISGVAQMGPFVQGSAITLFELDEEFHRTDLSIKAATNDQGEFSLKAKNLVTPYALFKANGFFNNEVSGEQSNNKISLYAFTDLSKRDEVNINTLTHLAHKRALFLASEKGLPVDSAKKQAETEVLNEFGIYENFDDAEDLNTSGKKAPNAALLALSILMQGGIPEAALNKILSEFASDIEKDGTLDDKKTATTIADWAYKQYTNYNLTKITSNLKKWNIATDAVLLKNYVNSFWNHNYGLEACTEKRKNKVRKNKNSTSNYANFYFICSSNMWREATEKEINRYYKPDSSESSEDSSKKKDGDVRGKEAEYSGYPMTCQVYENYAWREGNPSDCMLGFGGCTKKLQGILRQDTNGVQYVCDHQRWLSIDDCKKILGCELYTEKPNLGWNDAKNGDIRTDDKSGIVYVFDLVAWRLATIPEASLGGCTEEILDSVGYASKREDQIDSVHNCQYSQRKDENFCTNGRLEEGYYKCVSAINTTYDPQKEKFDQTKHYKTYKWVKMTGPETDIYMLNKGEKAEMGESSWGPINKDKCYVFEWNWREGDVTECVLGLGGCIGSRSGRIELGPAIKIDCGDYSCNSRFTTKTAKIIEGAEKRKYVCHYNNSTEAQYPLKTSWDLASSTDIDVAPRSCQDYNDDEIVAGVKNLYLCDSRHFKLLGPKEIQTYDSIEQAECNNIISDKNNSAIISVKNDKYVCHRDTFRLATPLEIKMGFGCTPRSSRLYKKMDGTKSYFICEAKYGPGQTTYKWTFLIGKNRYSMTDPRTQLGYETLNIGTQTWMAEDLHYDDSENYPSMQGRSWYESSRHKVGLHYTWSAVIDSVYWASKGKTCGNTGENKKSCGLPEKVQGICPEGWHIPTVKEYEQLEAWLTEIEIKKADIYFSQFNLGNYNPDTGFSDDGKFSYFWTSTEIDGTKASVWKMNNDENSFVENEKRNGSTVRCVKDD